MHDPPDLDRPVLGVRRAQRRAQIGGLGFSLFDRIGGRLPPTLEAKVLSKTWSACSPVLPPCGTRSTTCAMPKGHALARRKTVRPRALRDAHLISYSRISPIGVIVDDAFREHGETQHVGIEVRVCFSACTLVNAGVGFAAVDEFTVCLNTFSNVETRPFKTTQRVTVSLSRAKQNPLSRLAKIFVNAHL